MSKTVIDAAFKDDRRIISISFGEKCQGIGNDAFNGCDSLEEVDAKNISKIGSNAFAKCSKLGYIKAKSEQSVKICVISAFLSIPVGTFKLSKIVSEYVYKP